VTAPGAGAVAVAAARLAAQRIARRDQTDAAALVAWMGAMQAQDAAAARWAVALRLGGSPAGEAAIRRALDQGAIVRTHAMRWTWQLVAPGDLHWMLPLLAPALLRRADRRFRELGLDEATFRRSRAALERALRDGAHLTRDQLRAALEAAGVDTAGGRLSHLLGRAELEGIMCSGAARGPAATFALLETRAPRPPSAPWPRAQALAELARRYFRSRGPATLADFAWWSGLPPADARAALAAAAGALARETIGGRDAWRDPDAGAAPARAVAAAYLAPPFDEILIAYKDRGALLAPAHTGRMNGGGGMLPGAVLLGGRVVASWRRTLGRAQVAVEVRPFVRLTAAGRAQIARAARRYARFLGLAETVTIAA
jgi:hypothetical protein